MKSLKPGVNRRIHLFAAALLWSGVGMFLIIKGWEWIEPAKNIWFVPAAVAFGTLKSVLILDRSAKRGVARIIKMQDGTCLGAVYSWKTWILVLAMMSTGIMLRTFFDPGKYIGTVYVAIGWALLLSSRYGWLEWSGWVKSSD